MMKRFLSGASLVALGSLMFVAIDLATSFSSVGFTRPVYGMGWRPPHNDPRPGPQPVPEPSTLALLGLGAAGIGAYLYNKRKKR